MIAPLGNNSMTCARQITRRRATGQAFIGVAAKQFGGKRPGDGPTLPQRLGVQRIDRRARGRKGALDAGHR